MPTKLHAVDFASHRFNQRNSSFRGETCEEKRTDSDGGCFLTRFTGGIVGSRSNDDHFCREFTGRDASDGMEQLEQVCLQRE